MNPPQDPLDVAELILKLAATRPSSRGLHFLTFIADAVHRNRHGEALLVAAFEDREDGPVSARLEGALRNNEPATSVGGRPSRLPRAAIDSITATVEHFANFTDDELLDWIDAQG